MNPTTARTRARRGAATGLGIAVLAASTLTAGAASATTASPAAVQAAETVTGAQLRWGINAETQSAGFAPGTWNLISAGRIGNPGEGGRTLTTASDGARWSNGRAAGWSARSGNVTVIDKQRDGSHAVGDFVGTRQDSTGRNSTTTGVLSESEALFSGGTGTVEADGSARITWDGDLTVLYYSGMTYFHLSDPVLTVDAAGNGAVTATVGGYATSMEDMERWDRLPDTPVTLATLRDVAVAGQTISATPVYRGVSYDGPAGATAQVRTGAHWGAFPTDFVDFQQRTGQSTYWYSSGGQADARKVADPLRVSWGGAVEQFKEAGSISVTSRSVRFGPAQAISVAVRSGAGAATGRVSLTAGGRSLGTKTLSGGRATFTLPARSRVGSYALSARYAGSTATTAATGTGTLRIAKATTTLGAAVTRPTTRRSGRVDVRVASSTRSTATGRVTVSYRDAHNRTIRTTQATLRSGRAAVALPARPRGTYQVVVAYRGDAGHGAAASRTVRFAVR